MPKTLCKISIFLVLTSIVTYTCSHREYDYSVPDFILPDIYGRNVRLYRVLDYHSVMIITWAMWQRYSIWELNSFIPYSEELNAMNIKVLAVSQDGQSSLPDVGPFAEVHGWLDVYTVLCDTANMVPELYDMYAMPWTTVIDQEGEIVFEWREYHPGDELLILDTLRVIFDD